MSLTPFRHTLLISLLLSVLTSCTSEKQATRNAGAFDSSIVTSDKPLAHDQTSAATPDISQAQPYFVYSSNVQLARLENGKFEYNPQLLRVVGGIINVTIGMPNAGSSTIDQRAHTAMKAAIDIQQETGVEAVLLYLSLGENLPKITHSVATVAYAPRGMDWKDGEGTQIWDVEVSDIQVKPEAIRLAVTARKSKSNVALPIPTVYRKQYDFNKPRSSSSRSGDNQQSLDAQLFQLVGDIIPTEAGEIEHPYNVEEARSLIAQGANVNAVDDGQPLLIRAAQNGHINIMKILLDNGADVNVKDERDRTALMVAAGLSDPDMVRLLLSKGADVNAKDKDGYTAWTGSEMLGGGGDSRYRATRQLLRRAGAK